MEGRDPFGGSLASFPTESGAGMPMDEIQRWRGGEVDTDEVTKIGGLVGGIDGCCGYIGDQRIEERKMRIK